MVVVLGVVTQCVVSRSAVVTDVVVHSTKDDEATVAADTTRVRDGFSFVKRWIVQPVSIVIRSTTVKLLQIKYACILFMRIS